MHLNVCAKGLLPDLSNDFFLQQSYLFHVFTLYYYLAYDSSDLLFTPIQTRPDQERKNQFSAFSEDTHVVHCSMFFGTVWVNQNLPRRIRFLKGFLPFALQ